MALSAAEEMLEELNIVYRGLADVRMQSERFINEIDAGMPIEKRRLMELVNTLERVQKLLDNLRVSAYNLGLRPIGVLVDNASHEVKGLISIVNTVIRSIERGETDIARKKLELVKAITVDVSREVSIGSDAVASIIVALRDVWKRITPTA